MGPGKWAWLYVAHVFSGEFLVASALSLCLPTSYSRSLEHHKNWDAAGITCFLDARESSLGNEDE